MIADTVSFGGCMAPTAEVLEREARVLSGSVESIEVFEELERRRRLAQEGKTRLLTEEESLARLRSKRAHVWLPHRPRCPA